VCLSYEYSENGEGCPRCRAPEIAAGTDRQLVREGAESLPEPVEETIAEKLNFWWGEEDWGVPDSSQSDVLSARRDVYDQRRGEKTPPGEGMRLPLHKGKDQGKVCWP